MKTGDWGVLEPLFRDPAGAVSELKAQFTNNRMKPWPNPVGVRAPSGWPVSFGFQVS